MKNNFLIEYRERKKRKEQNCQLLDNRFNLNWKRELMNIGEKNKINKADKTCQCIESILINLHDMTP